MERPKDGKNANHIVDVGNLIDKKINTILSFRSLNNAGSLNCFTDGRQNHMTKICPFSILNQNFREI